MTNNKNKLTCSPIWQELTAHAKQTSQMRLEDLFAKDANRKSLYTISCAGLTLNYSQNHFLEETIALLAKLAHEAQLKNTITQLFSGQTINISENRPACHPLYRTPDTDRLDIKSTQEQCEQLVDHIHKGKWKGATGKTIKHIVNVGIGGSYLGPKMAIEALKAFSISDLTFHFISTPDDTLHQDVINAIDPEATLFIISSKSFSTVETMHNGAAVIQLLKECIGDASWMQHVIAITDKADKAIELGILPKHIYPVGNGVGGRYSIWSAIGLPIQLMIGTKQWQQFQSGAYQIDQHFQTAELQSNLPIILGLLNVWYTTFLNAHTHAIIPYAHRLRYFIPYLQQLEMESNGKCISQDGERIDYPTSPVIFGEEGCNGQHTYHQLLHQSHHLIPADIIVLDDQPGLMLASALSQVNALLYGKTEEQAYDELIKKGYTSEQAAKLAKYQYIPGNRPVNLIHLERLCPETLGALIALYEHKTFVSGVAWQINPFDQWGVELGKQLLPDILEAMEKDQIYEKNN